MNEFAPNNVKVGNVEIWKNRRFNEWHSPTDLFGNLEGCIDGYCPHNAHAYDRNSYYDPHTLPLLEKLKSGQQVLVQSDYCDRNQVDFITFDRLHTHSDNYKVLIFQERSRDLYAYKKPRTEWGGHQMQIHWNSVRFLALIPPVENPAFGKRGGVEQFKKQLADVTGLKSKEINGAMKILDSLNSPKGRPIKLKLPYGTEMDRSYKWFKEGNTELARRGVANMFNESPYFAAFFVGILTQQGNFNDVKALIPNNLTHRQIYNLEDNLHLFSNWYEQLSKNKEDLKECWKTWDTTFNFFNASLHFAISEAARSYEENMDPV